MQLSVGYPLIKDCPALILQLKMGAGKLVHTIHIRFAKENTDRLIFHIQPVCRGGFIQQKCCLSCDKLFSVRITGYLCQMEGVSRF